MLASWPASDLSSSESQSLFQVNGVRGPFDIMNHALAPSLVAVKTFELNLIIHNTRT